LCSGALFVVLQQQAKKKLNVGEMKVE